MLFTVKIGICSQDGSFLNASVATGKMKFSQDFWLFNWPLLNPQTTSSFARQIPMNLHVILSTRKKHFTELFSVSTIFPNHLPLNGLATDCSSRRI